MERDTTFVYLARAVSPQLGPRLLDLRLPGAIDGPLPGIGLLPTTKRIYPAGTLASNVVGFANTDGLAGLEYSFQKMLAGRNGERTFETGLSGSPIPDGHDIVRPAVPGTGLKLTLHRDIQWKAQQAITAQVHAVRADSGTAIVMDPRTGQLLALAVAPGFDPNDPGASPISAFGDPAIS